MLSEAMMKSVIKSMGFDPEELMTQAKSILKALSDRFVVVTSKLDDLLGGNAVLLKIIERQDAELVEIRRSLTNMAMYFQMNNAAPALTHNDIPVAGMGEQILNDMDELSDAAVDEVPPTQLQFMNETLLANIEAGGNPHGEGSDARL